MAEKNKVRGTDLNVIKFKTELLKVYIRDQETEGFASVDDDIDHITFNYDDGRDIFAQTPFTPGMSTDFESVKLQLSVAMALGKSTNKDPLLFDETTNTLNKIADAVNNSTDKVNEMSGEDIFGQIFDAILVEKEVIGEFLLNVETVLEQGAVIARQARKFIIDLEEDDKEDFIALTDNPAFTEAKEALTDSMQALGMYASVKSNLLKSGETFLDKVFSWGHTVGTNLRLVNFFGVKRSVKMKLAINKLTKLFK